MQKSCKKIIPIVGRNLNNRYFDNVILALDFSRSQLQLESGFQTNRHHAWERENSPFFLALTDTISVLSKVFVMFFLHLIYRFFDSVFFAMVNMTITLYICQRVSCIAFLNFHLLTEILMYLLRCRENFKIPFHMTLFAIKISDFEGEIEKNSIHSIKLG